MVDAESRVPSEQPAPITGARGLTRSAADILGSSDQDRRTFAGFHRRRSDSIKRSRLWKATPALSPIRSREFMTSHSSHAISSDTVCFSQLHDTPPLPRFPRLRACFGACPFPPRTDARFASKTSGGDDSPTRAEDFARSRTPARSPGIQGCHANPRIAPDTRRSRQIQYRSSFSHSREGPAVSV